MDYRIIGRNNGDNFFCIVLKETENEIMVMFPMMLEKHSFPIGPTTIRETYSATQLCPFTDDKIFTFYKPELTFIKPLSREAIPFYVTMINKHESVETMKRYNLESIIEKTPQLEIIENETDEELIQRLLEDDMPEEEESLTVVRGNKTVH